MFCNRSVLVRWDVRQHDIMQSEVTWVKANILKSYPALIDGHACTPKGMSTLFLLSYANSLPLKFCVSFWKQTRYMISVCTYRLDPSLTEVCGSLIINYNRSVVTPWTILVRDTVLLFREARTSHSLYPHISPISIKIIFLDYHSYQCFYFKVIRETTLPWKLLELAYLQRKSHKYIYLR